MIRELQFVFFTYLIERSVAFKYPKQVSLMKNQFLCHMPQQRLEQAKQGQDKKSKQLHPAYWWSCLYWKCDRGCFSPIGMPPLSFREQKRCSPLISCKCQHNAVRSPLCLCHPIRLRTIYGISQEICLAPDDFCISRWQVFCTNILRYFSLFGNEILDRTQAVRV